MVGACEWTLPTVEEVEQEPMEVVPDDNDNDTVKEGSPTQSGTWPHGHE